jgi:diguanylate cyclase (GGDEF)-like protein
MAILHQDQQRPRSEKRELLLVSSVAAPRHWTFQGFDIRVSQNIFLEDLTPQVSALVLICPSEKVIEQVRGLYACIRDEGVALLLAAHADDAAVPALLRTCDFDGFIDLSWPSPLIESLLECVLRSVELGRNIVEIQRAVLHETRAHHTQLYEQANHDELTRLFNLRHFENLMLREHWRHRRRGDVYSLVYLDLDNLKQLNTRFGHEGGSAALRELAHGITEVLSPTGVALRVGGDEFVVFLPGCNKHSALQFVDRVIENVRNRKFVARGESLTLSFSGGVASFPEDAAEYVDLLDRADRALMVAKERGKNQVTAWGPELQTKQEFS